MKNKEIIIGALILLLILANPVSTNNPIDLSQPKGIRNKNPGNIRATNIPWQGKVPFDENTDGEFEQFVSMPYGIRASLVNLRSYINQGTNTISKIISKWAPRTENDTDEYIAVVEEFTGIGRNDKIQFNQSDIVPLAWSIFYHENGGAYINEGDIYQAWELI